MFKTLNPMTTFMIRKRRKAAAVSRLSFCEKTRERERKIKRVENIIKRKIGNKPFGGIKIKIYRQIINKIRAGIGLVSLK